MGELVKADPEDAVLDRIKLVDRAIGQFRQAGVELLAPRARLAYELIELARIGVGRHAFREELEHHVPGPLAADLALVQGLERQLPRGAAAPARPAIGG
jgi:hypothetical protein